MKETYMVIEKGRTILKPRSIDKENYIDLGERGRYYRKNKLNDLTGKEWIKFINKFRNF